MTEETGAMKTLNALRQKMSEISVKLSKTLTERKAKAEENIKEHPLPYVMGALAGGVALGYLIAGKRKA